MIVCGKKPFSSRIVHGDTAAIGAHPWMAALFKVTDPKKAINLDNIIGPTCGGALVNDRHIVTAGHCLINKQAKNIAVALDFYRASQLSDDIFLKVKKVILHPKYVDHMKHPEFDIGVIELENPVQITDKIRPVCFPKPSELDFDNLLISGWGRLGKKI